MKCEERKERRGEESDRSSSYILRKYTGFISLLYKVVCVCVCTSVKKNVKLAEHDFTLYV